MLFVQFYNNQFYINNVYKPRQENADYIFTEDIEYLVIYDRFDAKTTEGQFKNVKISHLVTSVVSWAHKFMEVYHENIGTLHISEPMSTLDEFILMNSTSIKNTKVTVVVDNIVGLTSEHFTNEDIFYDITKINACTKLVCENAKNIIFAYGFPVDDIDLQKCNYNKVIINIHGDLCVNMSYILANIATNTLEICLYMNNIQIIDILANHRRIPNIVLKNTTAYYAGVDFSVLDIDPLLRNPTVESLIIKDRNASYTKSVLEANNTIKELVITGNNCDQGFISEICETNKHQIRYSKTKNARNTT